MNSLQINETNRLARYFSVEGFLNFIHSDQLHFTCLDNFEDMSEGLSNSEYDVHILKKLYPKIIVGNYHVHEKVHSDFDQRITDEKKYKKNVFASCWTTCLSESALLWKSYTNNGRGILFYQDVNVLKNRILNTSVQGNVVKYVNYLDMRKEPIQTNIFQKKEFYKSEEEYRFVLDMNLISDENSNATKTKNGVMLDLKKDFTESSVVLGYNIQPTEAVTLISTITNLGYPQKEISISKINWRKPE